MMHLAAVTGTATARDHDRVNAHGTGTLVDESRRCGVRGDVLRYISLLQRVDVVIKHGVRYK
jgi:hypothetical protein